jgi:hypothetical protein
VEIARSEAVEADLNRLIERRSRQKDPDEESKAWQESVRRYSECRREENRLAWCDYFERLSACLRARAEEYDHRAQLLMEATDERSLG